jgi:N-succinyldiaminopimelate aminotransferase
VRDQLANQGASQVWAEVTALAQLPGVLDLGQGWPDFGADDTARAAAADALCHSPDPRSNQYSGIAGRPELLSAVARYYKSTGVKSTAASEVLVTTSATEAIYVALQALCDPGDEVVFLEPFFPWYISHCKIFGAVPVTVRMQPAPDDSGGFKLDLGALREAFTRGAGGTKVFIHNSPHNPTGAVFTREETEAVAALCKEFDVVVLADEVYERCTFGGGGGGGGEEVEVVRMADVSGMQERTLTIGTSSKLLCLSGWRVGWMVGPPQLVGAIRMMHSYATFCAPTPLQLGVAAALEGIADEADSLTRARARAAAQAGHSGNRGTAAAWVAGAAGAWAGAADAAGGDASSAAPPAPGGTGAAGQGTQAAAAAAIARGGALTPDATAAVMADNAAVLAAALADVGLRVFTPRGGYFLVADVAPLALTSVEYCRQLAHGPAKVAAVPLDVFYDPASVPPPPTTYVRFAVCKKPETIAACAAAIRANPVTAGGARGD